MTTTRPDLFRILVEHSADAIWAADGTLRLTHCNPAFSALTGYAAETLRGRPLTELLTRESREYALQRLKAWARPDRATPPSPELLELDLRHADGQVVCSETMITPVCGTNGALAGCVGVTRNVADRLRIDERIRQSERNYRELVERSACFILRWRSDGIITFANTHTCEFFGFLPEELVGRHLVGSIVPETERSGQDLRELIAAIGADPISYRNTEHENIRWDGSRIWVAWSNAPGYDEQGRLIEILSVGQDVSERRQREQQLAYLTVHDPMTGLYNRAYFDTELERLAKGRKFPVSIVIASLENLHRLNEQQGRDAGDLLLMKTARLLKEAFRAEDLIARTGGDGFALLLPGLDEQQTAAMLHRFRQELQQASREEPQVLLCMGSGTAHAGPELHRAQREASANMTDEKRLYQQRLSASAA